MYIPRAFAVEDRKALADFIRANSFGILFSQAGEVGAMATHIPFLLDEERGLLYGHVARANPHGKGLDQTEVLVVFPGPHAYISPTWYGEPNTVPTWNYVTVHVYGTLVMRDDAESLRKILEETVRTYESALPTPWQADYDSAFISHLMQSIVAFQIQIDRIEGKWKLSQNHSLQRKQNLIRGLRAEGGAEARPIADLLEAHVEEVRKQMEAEESRKQTNGGEPTQHG